MLPLRFPGLWLSLGWLMILGFCILMLAPSPADISVGLNLDKLGHVMAYLLLMVWFCGIYSKKRYLLIACALLSLGIALEYGQRAIGYRSFEFADMVANGVGLVLGWLLALAVAGGWCLKIEQVINGSNSTST